MAPPGGGRGRGRGRGGKGGGRGGGGVRGGVEGGEDDEPSPEWLPLGLELEATRAARSPPAGQSPGPSPVLRRRGKGEASSKASHLLFGTNSLSSQLSQNSQFGALISS